MSETSAMAGGGQRKRGLLHQPRFLALAAAVAALAGAFALGWPGRQAPVPSAGFFPCLFHRATGWHCPGCGTTRGLAALLHGDWRAALGYNAAGLLVLGVAALLLARPWWIALSRNRWQPPALPRAAGWWLLALAVLYAILRNLPWFPFTALAP